MAYCLSSEDASQLNRILQQANKTYLKESRLHSQSNFNILRVLSAFRLLHPDSPSSLYDSIIYITKIYNPQNFKEWQQAVKSLSRPGFSSQTQHNRTQTSKYMKTYQNSFNRERTNGSHFQSKSYAQIKIPPEASFSYEASFDDRTNKDISQTNAETGKRYFMTKADSVIEPSKNHYISFEPYHQISGIYPHSYYQKENVNSTNIGESRKGQSALQYIEAIRRDIGTYSLNKTPVDQSFIKKIDSYQSPYLISQANMVPLDPEEEEMNQRAFEFLKINLKLKAFSSLAANNLAYQKAKEYRMKADTLNRAVLLQKSFQSLRDNVAFQRMVKQKQARSDSHLETKLKKNVMNVLKILFDLRNKKKPLNASHFSYVSYDFMLSLLLSVQQSGQSVEGDFVDLDSKISDFVNNHEVDKVYLIIKYFGRHSWMSAQAIQKLIEGYKKSILKRTFSILSLQRQQNLKYMNVRQSKIKKISFNALKNRWMKNRNTKIKVMEAQGKRNMVLLKKVMKSLLEVVYSAKLYSKRCEYLHKKYESTLKNNVLAIWQERAQEKIQDFKVMQEKVKLSQHPLTTFLKMFHFRKINEEINRIQNRQCQLCRYLNRRRAERVINSFRRKKQRGQRQVQIQRKVKLIYYITTLSKWKDSTKKGKVINKLFKTIKRYCFRNFIAPELQSAITEFKIVEESEMALKHKVVKGWKLFSQTQAKKYEQLYNNTLKLINQYNSKAAITILSLNLQHKKEQRKRQQVKQKRETLGEYLRESQRSRFLKLLWNHKSSVSLNRKRLEQINKLRQAKALTILRKNGQYVIDLSHKRSDLEENYQSHRAGFAVQQFKRFITQIKIKKIQQMRKQHVLRQVNNVAITLHNCNQQINEEASDHYQLKLAQKVIQAFRQMVSASKSLKQFIKQTQRNRMHELCKENVSWLWKQVQAKKKFKIFSNKFFLQKLRSRKDAIDNENEVSLMVVRRRVNMFMRSLQDASLNQRSMHEQQIKLRQLCQFIVINRLKVNYVDSLINKKYQFMVIKFRALKICQKIFTAWQQKNSKPTTYKLKSETNNLRKGNERLSTDFG